MALGRGDSNRDSEDQSNTRSKPRKKHTENTGKKLFSVFSVCVFPWLEWAKVEPHEIAGRSQPASGCLFACHSNSQLLTPVF
jgi:hypothetical protein